MNPSIQLQFQSLPSLLSLQSDFRKLSSRAKRLAVNLHGGSTPQGMNSVNSQWKLLNQLKEYLSKTSSTHSSSAKSTSEKHAIFELSKEWINFLQKYTPTSVLGYNFQNLTSNRQDNTKALQRPQHIRPNHSINKRIAKVPNVPQIVDTDTVLPWKTSNSEVSKVGENQEMFY